MKLSHWMLAFLPAVTLAACGDGSQTADVVQAATRGAAEAGQQLAAKAAELTGMTPEQAKEKLQELVNSAARELGAIRDSETARKLALEVERILEQVRGLAAKLGDKLDLAGLQTSLTELLQRFKDDPRVVSALESLRTKLDSFAR